MWNGERDERRSPVRPSASLRDEYERDRDRVLYSDAFHRLRGVTQVVRAGEAFPYHTRLTHSLKVAQVGRRLAQYLNRRGDGEDVDFDANRSVVATACLAHDLGHPPFGHAAENELDHQIRRRGIDDGFEGNPQSLRIVREVETNALFHEDRPNSHGRGLNLTRASMNAMIKYPWSRGESVPGCDYDTEEKFGYYAGDEELFEWIRGADADYRRTVEAKIMDWADDVTYAVHDVVDFYCAGLIPLEDLFQDTAEREAFIEHFESENEGTIAEEFDPARYMEELRKTGLDEPELKREYRATRATDALLDRLKSDLIEDFLSIPNAVALVERPDRNGWTVEINPMRRSEVEFLKELTFHYVVKNPALVSQQHGQRRIIATLFDAFLAAVDSGYDSEYGEYGEYEPEMIPLPFREDLQQASDRETRVRLVSDAITSMTERQIVELYARITGHTPGSLKEEILR